MAGISDKALKSQYAENKHRYNGGNELQNKEFSDGSGLEEYDATFRMYDPQLGRFWQIDPFADVSEDQSPYSFARNNPILLNDPIGLLSDSLHPQELAAVTVVGHIPSPQPRADVNTGLADVGTQGGDPAASSSPAPSTTSATVQPDQEDFGAIPIHRFELQEKLEHTIVEKPGWLGRLWFGVNYEGKNVLGERAYNQNLHYGPADPLGVGPAGAEEGAATIFEDISATKRIRPTSTINFAVGITRLRFEEALAKAAGQSWQLIKADGSIRRLVFNGVEYISRAFSKSGEATIEIRRAGELLQKYRLLD